MSAKDELHRQLIDLYETHRNRAHALGGQELADAVLALVEPILAGRDSETAGLVHERDTWVGRTILAEAELEVGRSDVRRAESELAGARAAVERVRALQMQWRERADGFHSRMPGVAREVDRCADDLRRALAGDTP